MQVEQLKGKITIKYLELPFNSGSLDKSEGKKNYKTNLYLGQSAKSNGLVLSPKQDIYHHCLQGSVIMEETAEVTYELGGWHRAPRNAAIWAGHCHCTPEPTAVCVYLP